jgi:hypothetical protein
LTRAYKILQIGYEYYPAKNAVEKMPQGHALPVDRVAWIDIFLKIFSAEATAESTHRNCTGYEYQNTSNKQE